MLELGELIKTRLLDAGAALAGIAALDGMRSTDRDEILDAQKARRTARQRALHILGVEETVCGVCIAVCPWTRRYVSGATLAQ